MRLNLDTGPQTEAAFCGSAHLPFSHLHLQTLPSSIADILPGLVSCYKAQGRYMILVFPSLRLDLTSMPTPRRNSTSTPESTDTSLEDILLQRLVSTYMPCLTKDRLLAQSCRTRKRAKPGRRYGQLSPSRALLAGRWSRRGEDLAAASRRQTRA